MKRTSTVRALGTSIAIVALAMSVTSCAPESKPKPTSASTPTSTSAASKTPRATPSATPTAAGSAAKNDNASFVPPIPYLSIPSLAFVDSSVAGIATKFRDALPQVPGLTISPAACGDAVVRANAEGSLVANGDGSGVSVNPNSTLVNNGDGSGTFVINGVSVVVNGDGSGTYASDSVTVTNNGDGSGTYVDPTTSVTINGDGSGTRVDTNGGSIVNNGDGSGTYVNGAVSITNNGDGSGTYINGSTTVVNLGDGTALIDGTEFKADKVPAAPKVGTFPPMGNLAPLQYCGITITLQSGVLFDFDKSDVRPDASATLDALAKVMKDLNVPAAEVGGHTDSIDTEEYNQALSERRAQAVVDALAKRGVTSNLTPVGYGESAPIAPNEINGVDNPTGRELNRRVEIYIPTF